MSAAKITLGVRLSDELSNDDEIDIMERIEEAIIQAVRALGVSEPLIVRGEWE